MILLIASHVVFFHSCSTHAVIDGGYNEIYYNMNYYIYKENDTIL